MFEKIFHHASYLEQGLDALSLRMQVTQNNIANAETPGFKASSVDFETHLRAQLEQQNGFRNKMTRPGHRNFGMSTDDAITIRVRDNTTMRMDENNVDIDYENAQLAETQIYYNTVIQKLNSEYMRLRMAIRETT